MGVAIIAGYVWWNNWRIDAIEKDLRSRGCFIMGDLQYVFVPPTMGEQEIVSTLSALRSVRRPIGLHLVNCRLGDTAVEIIGDMTWLESLDVAFTTLNDKQIAQLRRLQRLERFRLTGTHISDAALASLDQLRELRELDLGDTATSESTIRKSLSSLPKLDLGETIQSASNVSKTAK